MTLWDRCCYGLEARWDALVHHKLKGHRVVWRDHIDVWYGCTGDITCHACPAAGDEDVFFWVRYWPWISWIAQRVCPHPAWFHLERDDRLDEWFCTQCGAKTISPPAA